MSYLNRNSMIFDQRPRRGKQRERALKCHFMFCALRLNGNNYEHMLTFLYSLAPITNVEAIEGQQAHLYCPITTPASDKVSMVLWFRDDVGVPIYRSVNCLFLYLWPAITNFFFFFSGLMFAARQ